MRLGTVPSLPIIRHCMEMQETKFGSTDNHIFGRDYGFRVKLWAFEPLYRSFRVMQHLLVFLGWKGSDTKRMICENGVEVLPVNLLQFFKGGSAAALLPSECIVF